MNKEVAVKYLQLLLSCYKGYTGSITVFPNLWTEVLPAFVCQELRMLNKHQKWHFCSFIPPSPRISLNRNIKITLLRFTQNECPFVILSQKRYYIARQHMYTQLFRVICGICMRLIYDCTQQNQVPTPGGALPCPDLCVLVCPIQIEKEQVAL